ncbi:MAG: methylamine utilization protein [Congregibacter sp.]|nr:methylamine utilization protein [Congregibacter sp.]MDP5069804.1 methylamine utilization protein [Congregibacter sp.]
MKFWYYTVLICAASFSRPLLAASYELELVAQDGSPVPGAVLYLEPLDDTALNIVAPGVMDQVDRQFLPHILVVQRGAEVDFPNSDSIKHHVFSFSKAKTFEIQLYKGATATPVVFDQDGEIELGCNVHDWMLGYIYVVNTPFFARSDAKGIALIDAPPGRYQLGVWHPQIQEDFESLKREIRSADLRHQVVLVQPLLPRYEPESADEFSDY